MVLAEKDLSGSLVIQLIMWHTEDKAIIALQCSYSEAYTGQGFELTSPTASIKL